MCEPTTILTAASLVLTAAGTGASMYGANQQDKAQARAIDEASRRNYQNAIESAKVNRELLDAENARQAVFKSNAEGIQDEQQRLGSANNVKEQQADETQRLASVYNAPSDQVLALSASPGYENSDEPGVRAVNDAKTTSLKNVADYLRGIGSARAGMDAFGNTMMNRGIAMNESNARLGQIQNLSGISLGAYGAERGGSDNMQNLLGSNIANDYQRGLISAQGAGAGWNTTGQLMSGAGQLSGYGSSMMRHSPNSTNSAYVKSVSAPKTEYLGKSNVSNYLGRIS